MRRIEKLPEPAELTAWRAANQGLPNFGYAALTKEVAAVVKVQLLKEQGWLCAYTGLRIDGDSSHIEHLLPQQRCKESGQIHLTISYSNIVACYPAPNCSSPVGFGAIHKGNWPRTEEWHLFVSPLSENCESRFHFDRHGSITPAASVDQAANETINRLRLDHPALTRFRRQAMLVVDGLDLKQARVRLRMLQTQKTGKLDQFCFAIKPALERHIRRLEAIIKSRRKN
ncbi:MAG TPA: retron system putative HNH endonuclease [Verrucomicrobiales bacterium]|jgi:uncharacterized protein (TIGR02646 family)|nr:retron system putative HNH endonuclease [Verrucomicrobiales bacterium]